MAPLRKFRPVTLASQLVPDWAPVWLRERADEVVMAAPCGFCGADKGWRCENNTHDGQMWGRYFKREVHRTRREHPDCPPEHRVVPAR